MSTFRPGAEHAVHRCAEVINAARGPDPAGALRKALTDAGEDVGSLTTEDVLALQRAARRFERLAHAGSTADAAQELNRLLKGCQAPRLTAHDGTAWHLHIDSSDDSPWAQWFTSSSALALAMVLTDTQQSPLAICAAPDCTKAFATHSPGQRRRYCSSTCSSRVRVANLRQRRRSTTSGHSAATSPSDS